MKTFKTLGIDPSITSTGLSCIVVDGNISLITDHVSPDKKPREYTHRFERYSSLLSEIIDFVQDQEPDLIVLEGYSYASRGRALISLSEFGGILRSTLLKLKIPTVEVAPTRLKKFILKGNSSKDAVHCKLKEIFDWIEPVENEDELDATVASLFGLSLIYHAQNVTISVKDLDKECLDDTIDHIQNNDKGALDQNDAWWWEELIENTANISTNNCI